MKLKIRITKPATPYQIKAFYSSNKHVYNDVLETQETNTRFDDLFRLTILNLKENPDVSTRVS